jgi:hypothetical protein
VAYVKNVGFVNVATNNLAGWSGNTTFLTPAPPTYDPAGLKTFQNGVNHNTYEFPNYSIATGTPQPSDIILNNWVYLNQRFGQNIVTLGTNVTVWNNIFHVKVFGNYVTIQFAVNGPAGNQNTDYVIFTLNNTLFYPSMGVLFEVFDENQAIIKMQADTNGNIRARGDYTQFRFRLSGEVTFRIR